MSWLDDALPFGYALLLFSRPLQLPLARSRPLSPTPSPSPSPTGLRDTAAIASARAAEVHGLEVLDFGIEDDANNYTRFLILGTKPCELFIAGGNLRRKTRNAQGSSNQSTCCLLFGKKQDRMMRLHGPRNDRQIAYLLGRQYRKTGKIRQYQVR